jgi:hypothetical protein
MLDWLGTGLMNGCQYNKGLRPFRNGGWEYYEQFEAIFPRPGPQGLYVFSTSIESGKEVESGLDGELEAGELEGGMRAEEADIEEGYVEGVVSATELESGGYPVFESGYLERLMWGEHGNMEGGYNEESKLWR